MRPGVRTDDRLEVASATQRMTSRPPSRPSTGPERHLKVASASSRGSRSRPSRLGSRRTTKMRPGVRTGDRRLRRATTDRRQRRCARPPSGRRPDLSRRVLRRRADARAVPSESRCCCSPSPREAPPEGATSGRRNSPGPRCCGLHFRPPPRRRRRYGPRTPRRVRAGIQEIRKRGRPTRNEPKARGGTRVNGARERPCVRPSTLVRPPGRRPAWTPPPGRTPAQ